MAGVQSGREISNDLHYRKDVCAAWFMPISLRNSALTQAEQFLLKISSEPLGKTQ